MSLEDPRDPADAVTEERSASELESLLGELVIGRDDHMNAPGFVIRPDTVQETLERLRTEAGFDHCSCVTARTGTRRSTT